MTENAPAPTPQLTEEQCRMAEARIVHDAALIENGARFNANGTLILTEEEVTALAIVGIAGAQHETDAGLLTWLDQSCSEVLSQKDPDVVIAAKTLTRARNIMRQSGVETLRDLYVIGRNGFADLRNAGVGVVDFVATLFDEPGIAWPNEPVPQKAAEVCGNLNQVSALVLDKARTYTKRGLTTGLSLADILQTPDEEIAERFFPRSDGVSSSEKPRVAAEIVAEAKKFAAKFLAARERTKLQS